MTGTKSIVFLSEGFMLAHVQSELRDAIGEANRAGAHVHAIDVRRPEQRTRLRAAVRVAS